MKALLFLNGPEGWQTGVEDGFSAAEASALIDGFRCFYLEAEVRKHGGAVALERARTLVRSFRPDLVVVFHVAHQAIIGPILDTLQELKPIPTLVYDEGDMYGGLAKPLTAAMKSTMRRADFVSIRGLGPFQRAVGALNPNIFYTPHHADLARFDEPPPPWPERDHFITFVGNRNKPRILPALRRLPGAKGRESFVQGIGRQHTGRFYLYGDGWQGFAGNRGSLPFQDQMKIYRRTMISVAYEHYPEVPYYFSNRLPLALMSGSLYVCHEHGGYAEIFRGCDFIHFFRSTSEAVDLIAYLETVDPRELAARSRRAREFAMAHYHPGVVWPSFLRTVAARAGHPA